MDVLDDDANARSGNATSLVRSTSPSRRMLWASCR
jgi:hypothetical protein